MSLFFITGNENKLAGIKQHVPQVQMLSLELPEVQEIDPYKIISAKLLEAMRHCDGRVIVEDTSLYFDCLNGLPGPLIKWFLHSMGNDGLYTLAEKFDNFGVEAKTILGLADSDGEIAFFEGSQKGTVVKPTSSGGFGWDPIFQPEGASKSFAEMTLQEKNENSMRAAAAKQLQQYLEGQKN